MDPRIMIAANEVINVIKVMLDPSSNQNQRMQGYQVYEDFKKNSPLCSEIGFYMFNRENNFETSLRLCGLHLVEWNIQNHWDRIDGNRRKEFMAAAIQMIEKADFNEDSCLKEAIVKVAIEIIKRTWPQEWSSLFEDLSNLQAMGSAQLELVLIIFSSLSEDLNGLDGKVKQQRRRDMTTTLNEHLQDLFQFFVTTIYDKAMELKQLDTEENVRLINATLYAITEYSSWVKFDFILTANNILFKVLFWLLEVDKIKYYAAKCLSEIFSRKDQVEKRVEMIPIMNDEALDIIENTAQKADLSHNSEEYKFLKMLAEMLLHFGQYQIAVLWGDDRGFKKRPQCFERYLKIMLYFSKHQSMVISLTAAKLWYVYTTHSQIQEDDIFLAAVKYLPQELLRSAAKLCHPDLIHNPGSKYSLMDFDDADEFSEYFSESRRISIDVLRQLMILAPLDMLQFCLLKTKEYVAMKQPTIKGMPTKKILRTNYYLLWQAFCAFCKQISFVAFTKMKNNVTPEAIQLSNEILKNLVEYTSECPVFMIPIILAIESLFPVFGYTKDLLMPTLQKLSSLVHASLSEEDDSLQYKVKRQAVFTLVSLCRNYPHALVDSYEDLQVFFDQKVRENALSDHEKRLMIEGLLHVCKSLENPDMKKTFIDQVFSLPRTFFNRSDVKEALSNVSSFISFLGFDLSNINDEAAKTRRNELKMAVFTLEAATRALCMFKEEEINDNSTDNEESEHLVKYPWIQVMITILPDIFDLTKQICLLWTATEKFSSVFKDALKQHDVEVLPSLLKKNAPNEDVDEMNQPHSEQYCIFNIYEAIHTSLSLYGRCVGPTLYSLQGMLDVYTEKVVKNWVFLPNYRMRKAWRCMVRAFVIYCPAKYYQSIVGPFLSIAFEQMYQRLSTEWPRIVEKVETKKKSYGDDTDENEGDEASEIIDLRVMYNLSKEVLEILMKFCTMQKEKDKKNDKKENGENLHNNPLQTIGKLGEFLLSFQGTNMMLITIVFSSLTWPDSSVIPKVCNLINLIVNKIFISNNTVNPEIPNQMLLWLLQGLQKHGSDQAVQGPLLNTILSFYVLLRKHYPSIVHIMMMVPTCKEEDLKEFDISVFLEEEASLDTKKRKIFRKLLEGAIGKTISELHKNDLKIKDLPPLPPRVKPKTDVLASTEDSGLCALFVADE